MMTDGESRLTTPVIGVRSWYVSFASQGRRAGRTTQTFETENQAKAFALKMLAQGFEPSAGTMNSHTPKKMIPPSGAACWARSG
jgi:hypothetical protein